jgi:hypothetical protein
MTTSNLTDPQEQIQNTLKRNAEIKKPKAEIATFSSIKELKDLVTNIRDHGELPPELIFYKNKRIIHGSIISEYIHQFNGNLELIIKRCTSKQNIFFTGSSKASGLKDTDTLEGFLKKYSKVYNNIIGSFELARGKEAVVYRIEHIGLEEIVAKCLLFEPNATNEEIINAYKGIFYESQTLKLN